MFARCPAATKADSTTSSDSWLSPCTAMVLGREVNRNAECHAAACASQHSRLLSCMHTP